MQRESDRFKVTFTIYEYGSGMIRPRVLKRHEKTGYSMIDRPSLHGLDLNLDRFETIL